MTRDEATAIGRRNGDEYRRSLCRDFDHAFVRHGRVLTCSRCGLLAHHLPRPSFPSAYYGGTVTVPSLSRWVAGTADPADSLFHGDSETRVLIISSYEEA